MTQQQVRTRDVKAYGTDAAHRPLNGLSIPRRLTGAHDVEIEILYCGVCHSDLHQARNEWGNTIYPCIPGHEIVGRVTGVGNHVNKFKKGDLAAVGCMVDSCRVCEYCQEGLQQYCIKGAVFTYNDHDKILDTRTFGGYAESIVVDEQFVLRVPENLDLPAVAPLLCAGITTWSPLRHWQAGPGKKVGIIGIGGLGHMGIKFARAMGAHVVVFTTSPSKVGDAKRLGAHEVVLSTDEEQMNRHDRSFHFILDAVSANHDINAYLRLLQLDGTLTLVGVPEKPIDIGPFNVMLPRRNFAGSAIGGIAETQEMLDFCAEHNIVSDIEMINIQEINQAYERLLKGDVRYRFVIDMRSLKDQ